MRKLRVLNADEIAIGFEVFGRNQQHAWFRLQSTDHIQSKKKEKAVSHQTLISPSLNWPIELQKPKNWEAASDPKQAQLLGHN